MYSVFYNKKNLLTSITLRYDVDVSACTIIGCSSHKAIKGFVTAIGEPASPPPPQPKFLNSTFVVINWGKDFQV